ncbi:MAG: SRPBCC family protein [Filimonas sp.]|nr:SRPBCC family protein [Filimonas sp.]
MRFVKLGIISFVVLFLLLTAIGSLFPSNVIVSRAVDIAVSADSVKPYIAQYSKWNDWMEGAKTSELKVVAKDSTEAFFGTMIIRETAQTDSSWSHDWKGRSTVQHSTIQVIPGATFCTVQWKFEQHLKWYPWEKFSSMMNDKILGTSMEKSLANLKQQLEHH